MTLFSHSDMFVPIEVAILKKMPSIEKVIGFLEKVIGFLEQTPGLFFMSLMSGIIKSRVIP